jgi:hypothetical protein
MNYSSLIFHVTDGFKVYGIYNKNLPWEVRAKSESLSLFCEHDAHSRGHTMLVTTRKSNGTFQTSKFTMATMGNVLINE